MPETIEKRRVVETMAAFLRQPVEKLADGVVLTDLVSESFVLVELVIELQEQLGVRFGQEELKDVRTVGDLAGLIVKQKGGPPAGGPP